jgi:hypothetical protein
VIKGITAPPLAASEIIPIVVPPVPDLIVTFTAVAEEFVSTNCVRSRKTDAVPLAATIAVSVVDAMVVGVTNVIPRGDKVVIARPTLSSRRSARCPLEPLIAAAVAATNPPTLTGFPLSVVRDATLPTTCAFKLEAVAWLTVSPPWSVGSVTGIESAVVFAPNVTDAPPTCVISLLSPPDRFMEKGLTVAVVYVGAAEVDDPITIGPTWPVSAAP